MFPEDNLREVNRRLRHYYKYNPIFGNCMDIHSSFPLSDFEMMVDNEEVKEYYDFLKEKYNLLQMGEWLLRDRNLLGESFFVGNWDKSNYEWKEWVQYPPEYVNVKSIPGTNQKLFTLLPDPEVKKIADSNNPADRALSEALMRYNPKYYELASLGEDYEVSNTRVIHFANKISGYSDRGFSLGKRCLKDLIYEDKLRMLQYTFVDRHLFPIKIFKLGSKEKGWIPGKKHFDNFKKLLLQAANDPDFSIIYHFGVEVDYVGTKDKIENLIPHFDWVAKRIMVGLFANDALVSGESPGYSAQTINLRMLFHRYLTVRESLQKVYRDKIFLPIAQHQGFIRQTKVEKKNSIKILSKSFPTKRYYLPDFLWRKTNLLNSQAEQEFLMRLSDKGDIPFMLLAEVFGFDTKTLEHYRKMEAGTFNDRVTRETIYEDFKKDPEMLNDYVTGKDAVSLLKDKYERDKQNKVTKKLRDLKDKPIHKVDMSEEKEELGISEPELPENPIDSTPEMGENLKNPPGSEGESSPI